MRSPSKVVAIVQARLGSTRLPNKVLKPIGDRSLIEVLLLRLSKAREVDEVIVATSVGKKNDPLEAHVRSLGFECFRGDEDDVLDRYLQAATSAGADVVVRVTGDCPLIDPEIVDNVVHRFRDAGVDYVGNAYPASFPNGLDTEVFSFEALRRAAAEATERYDREHVTPYLRRPGFFKQDAVIGDEDLSSRRWTVDELPDYEVVRAVFAHFAPDIHFGWRQVLDLERERPELFAANRSIVRNEGATMGTGQKLLRRAKRVIPEGNMRSTDRPGTFVADRWPAYFSKAVGCRVWDLDGREYIDMSSMGGGTSLLGYAHPEVDAVVRDAVSAGVVSTLNCPEEVGLAEQLLALHPWAGMVQLSETTGGAMAFALRIARAVAGRDQVAVCGGHGYCETRSGVESSEATMRSWGPVVSFGSGDDTPIERLLAERPIGVIVVDLAGDRGSDVDFLRRVRALASRHGVVLVFDETLSGFRDTLGGLHTRYGVDPDLAMFGKALGNGYPVAATIGRREILERSSSLGIDSRFNSGRIGPVAALATLAVMERTKSWELVRRTGLEIRLRWQALADKHGLRIETRGMPALPGMSFVGPNAAPYRTLLTQEMLAAGYLVGESVAVSVAHTADILGGFFEDLDPVFSLIRECEDGRDVFGCLKGPVHQGVPGRTA